MIVDVLTSRTHASWERLLEEMSVAQIKAILIKSCLVGSVLIANTPLEANADEPASTTSTTRSRPPYDESSQRARALAERELSDDELGAALASQLEELFGHWYGTAWGLGAPQTRTPGEGKINCGMFVGRTLVDAGFVIDHVKLQRQPAELIIKTLTTKDRIKRWRNKSTDAFIQGVQEMGPGLYIIGLDFHVGYLLVREDLEVRFIHASYVTHTVVDEPAASAVPIETSKYRVVGKLFSEELLSSFRTREEIEVKGRW